MKQKMNNNNFGLLTLIASATQSSLSTRKEGEEGESANSYAQNIILFILLFVFYQTFAADPNSNSLLNTAANAAYLSPLEKEIVYEINLFRSDPAQYAEKYIAPLAARYNNKILSYPGDIPIKTVEGVSALNECVRELKKVKPLPLVYPDDNLTRAAEDHCADQSRTGKTGHVGSDNSNLRARIERHGKWENQIAENIAYGNTSARQVIVFLLIDDNVRSRGHRKTFLNPNLKMVGISCGKHPEYKTMCVMDFAAGMRETNN
jgi:uncharacterized protein YkwD